MSLLQEGNTARQIFKLPLEHGKSLVSPERIKIGSSAPEVYQEILRLNQYVRDVSVVFYKPGEDSHTGVLTQGPVWFPKQIANIDFLRNLSDLNFKNSEKTSVMAICSCVKLEGGELMQIPMMDFSIPGDEVKINDGALNEGIEVGDLANLFNSIKGALLITDESFHFWSPNLMTIPEWDNFMEARLVAERQRITNHKFKPIYDSGFINDSMERGFSALRIFSYPKIGKEKTPEVVALTK
jgi:hypothetical protein